MKKILLGFAIFTGVLTLVACDGNNIASESSNNEPIRIVLLPSESGSQFAIIHDYLEQLIEEATGRPGEVITTTNNNVAIEAIAQGAADIAWLGVTSYIIASEQNPNVRAIFTDSGESGTLDDAVYYAFIAVRYEDADDWMDGSGGFDLSGLEGSVISFVSPTSTSGFVIPGTYIVNRFDLNSLDDLATPGFFGQVNFLESHQGSAFSLINGQSNVASFMNQESLFEHVGGPLNGVGMIYQVREDAVAPLNQVRGERLMIIHSITVPNGPFVANFDNLTQEEVDAIVEIFTSDAVAKNENFFGSNPSVVSFLPRISGNERFVPVDPSFYDDLR